MAKSHYTTILCILVFSGFIVAITSIGLLTQYFDVISKTTGPVGAFMMIAILLGSLIYMVFAFAHVANASIEIAQEEYNHNLYHYRV
jgi:hypothetical protein